MAENLYHQFKLRMPAALFERLDAAASEANRSTSAEIIGRLETTFPGEDGEKTLHLTQRQFEQAIQRTTVEVAANYERRYAAALERNEFDEGTDVAFVLSAREALDMALKASSVLDGPVVAPLIQSAKDNLDSMFRLYELQAKAREEEVEAADSYLDTPRFSRMKPTGAPPNKFDEVVDKRAGQLIEKLDLLANLADFALAVERFNQLRDRTDLSEEEHSMLEGVIDRWGNPPSWNTGRFEANADLPNL